MAIVPSGINAKISFFENHIDAWTTNADAIGLATAQLTQLTALITAARTAYNDALTARDAAKSATLVQRIAVDAMASLGGDMIKTVRAYAETNNNPSVFSLAQIPAPSEPSPLGPPASPTELSASITTAGTVVLRFAASKQGGTSFTVERSTVTPGGSPSAWVLIGVAEEKVFEDDGVPVGLASALYRVTARRSGGVSQPTAPVSVLFGSTGAAVDTGTGTGQAASGGDIKLAA